MNRRTFLKTLIMSSGSLLFNATNNFSANPDNNSIKIFMLYNNMGSSSDLVDDWGLSLWVEDNHSAVLFDTGANPTILWENIAGSGVDIGRLSTIVISHNHWDHISGLPILLQNSTRKLNIFVPDADLDTIRSTIPNAEVTGVSKPVQISDNIWSTGQMKGLFRGEPIYEQSITLVQKNLAFLFTGCSHPGIVKIVEKTKELFPKNRLGLVGGGFHLMNRSLEEIQIISSRLKQLDVSNLAPSHCTGELALNIFKDEWDEHFINLNIGDSLHSHTLTSL